MNSFKLWGSALPHIYQVSFRYHLKPFLRYRCDRQTHRQTDAGKTINELPLVVLNNGYYICSHHWCFMLALPHINVELSLEKSFRDNLKFEKVRIQFPLKLY